MKNPKDTPQAPKTTAEIVEDDLLDDVTGASNTSLFRLSHPKGAPQAIAPSGD